MQMLYYLTCVACNRKGTCLAQMAHLRHGKWNICDERNIYDTNGTFETFKGTFTTCKKEHSQQLTAHLMHCDRL